jgi:3-isopropylmalate/(R)-2-methylmalate dehydratase small subunit
MTQRLISGRAHVYGDHVDTDAIIAGKYTKTLDPASLAAHVLEDLDPEFARTVRPGDILVAGRNFGCGSSREQAPLALKTAGVAAVVAESFARIFFRNAINIGLPAFELRAAGIAAGDELVIDPASGTIENRTRPAVHRAAALPPIMMAILEAGGLAAYLSRHGDYRMTGESPDE